MTHPDARPEPIVAPFHLAGLCDLWDVYDTAAPLCIVSGASYADAVREMLRATDHYCRLGMTVTVADRTGREVSWEVLGRRSWTRFIITPAGAHICNRCQWRPAFDAYVNCDGCDRDIARGIADWYPRAEAAAKATAEASAEVARLRS